MFWWLIFCAEVIMILGSTEAHASKAIYLESYRPNHPEFSCLQRFLRLRGYHRVKKMNSLDLLSLQLLPASIVVFKQGPNSRRYLIPVRVHSPQMRARMLTMYLDLFLESLRLKRYTKPPVQKSLPIPSTKKRKLRAKRAKQRKKRHRFASQRIKHRSVRNQTIPFQNHVSGEQKSHPDKRVPVPPKRVVGKKQRITHPQTHPRTSIVKMGNNPSRSTSVSKSSIRMVRSKPRKKSPIQRRVDNRRVKLAVVVRRTPKRLVKKRNKTKQNDDLGVHFVLGFSGGFRWSNFEQLLGGGRAFVGLNIQRWSLRVELALHTFTLHEQQRPIFLLRPAFWLGWQFPLGHFERWLQFHVLAGLGSELFVLEQKASYVTNVQWGGMFGASINWQLVNQWSLFFRPGLLVFPKGFNVNAPQKRKSSSPAIQLEVSIGFQTRF